MSSPEPDGASPAGDPGERLLADAVACLGDAFITVGRDGCITSWNAGSTTLLGWTAEEVVGRPITVIYPGGQGVAEPALAVPSPGLLETERVHRDGHRVPVSLRISTLRDREGEVIGTVAVARDLTHELQVRADLDRARRQAQDSFAHSVLPQLTVSPTGTITAVNQALLGLSGYREDELVGRSYEDFALDEQLDEVASRWTERWRERHGTGLDVGRRVRPLRRADGQVVETLVSTVRVLGDDGELLRAEMALEDISAVLSAERSVRASEARWRGLAQRSSDVAFLVDPKGVVLFATPSVHQHFGHEESAVVGSSGFDWMHPDDVATAVEAWKRVAQRDGTPEIFRIRMRHADGSWRWVEETVTNRLDDPDITAMVVNITDITEVLRAEEQLSLLTETDQLTGLLSRSAIIASLDKALHDTPGERTALVVADLDGFRVVNASYGHAAGDEVLTAVSERLSGVARRGESLGRIAGDRFALVLTAVEGSHELGEVVQRLAAALQQPVPVRGGRELALTVTVAGVLGVAADPTVTVDSATLVDAAEAALASARAEGHTRVRVEPSVTRSKVLARAAVVDGLRRALRRDELVVHYQPVIDLRSGRVRGAEALVRWQHPDRGLLLPAEFIDAAEESGQIVELGAAVLTRACVMAQRWVTGAGGPDFKVAVNLSARQIAQPDIVASVQQALSRAGVASRNLVLEVTESAVMADVDAARATLQELRGLGVQLAVDDFGTGYSSFTYLKHFPVNSLKVDRSFVSGLTTDADDTAIVTSVINLAATVGLDCVAEGVETVAQAQRLQDLGCAAGQGFVWARPMTDDALDVWLAEHQRSPLTVGGGDQGVAPRGARATRPLDPRVRSRVLEMQDEGASLHTIAAALNAEGVPTGEGKRWHARSVARVLQALLPG